MGTLPVPGRLVKIVGVDGRGVTSVAHKDDDPPEYNC